MFLSFSKSREMHWQLTLENGEKVIPLTPIGHGSQGTVWTALLHGSKVAAKVCLKTVKCDLSNERNVYNQITQSGLEVGPKYFGYGKVTGPTDIDSEKTGKVGEFLCFALHGVSLEYITYSDDTLDENEALAVGIGALKQLENMHSVGFIFCDVSPGNFLLTTNSMRHTKNMNVVISDFGCAESFLRHDIKTGDVQHRPKMPQKFSGTPLFASRHSLSGWTQSRRDDLEALGYMLLYFAGIYSDITFSGVNVSKKMLQTMAIEKEDIDILCKKRTIFSRRFVGKVQNYLQMCRNIGFDEKPDYDALEKILVEN